MSKVKELKLKLEECEKKLLLKKEKLVSKKKVKKKIKKIIDSVKKDKLDDIKDEKDDDEKNDDEKDDEKIVKDVILELLDRVDDEIDVIDDKEAEEKLKKIEGEKLKKIEEDLIKKSKTDIMTRLITDVERNNMIEKIDDKLSKIDFEYEEDLQKLKDRFKEKKISMLSEKDSLEEERKDQKPIRTYDGYRGDSDEKRFYKHPTYEKSKEIIKDMTDKYVKLKLDTEFKKNPNLKPFEYGKNLGVKLFENDPKFLLDVINKADIDINNIQMQDIIFTIDDSIDDDLNKWRSDLIKKREEEEEKIKLTKEQEEEKIKLAKEQEEEKIKLAKEQGEDAEISDDLNAIKEYLTLEVKKSSDEPVVYQVDNHIIPIMYLHIQEKNNQNCFFNNFDFGSNKPFKSIDRENYSILTDGNKIIIDDKTIKNLVLSYEDCPEKNKIMIVPFTLQSRLKTKNKKTSWAHANILIFNSIRNEIERFEPHGKETSATGLSNNVLESNILKHIVKPFNKLAKTDFKFISSDESCPSNFRGFQSYEGDALKKSVDLGDEVVISDPDGYCLSWSMFYFDARLKFPSLTAKRLKKAIFETISTDPENLRNFIRGQMDFVEDTVNKAFEGSDKTYRKYIVLSNIEGRFAGMTTAKLKKEQSLWEPTKILLDDYREDIDAFTEDQIEKNIESQ